MKNELGKKYWESWVRLNQELCEFGVIFEDVWRNSEDDLNERNSIIIDEMWGLMEELNEIIGKKFPEEVK
jgi:hypothetical protein